MRNNVGTNVLHLYEKAFKVPGQTFLSEKSNGTRFLGKDTRRFSVSLRISEKSTEFFKLTENAGEIFARKNNG